MIGSGTIALTGSNTYSGPTWISGGALRANVGVGLPSGSVLVLDGGVLESNGSASFTSSLGSSLGDVEWTSNGGGFSANGGVMTVDLGGSGGTLNWGTSVGTKIVGTLMFGSPTANNETLFVNPINLRGATRTIQVTAGLGGDFAEMSGSLINSTGTAGLTETGNGLLLLAASNSYNGTTTISGGTLQIGSGGASGTLGSGPVVDNAALAFSRSDTITVANAISGSGSVAQNGLGTLILTASNTYGGGTTITAGTLAVSSSANLGTGGLAFSGSGAGLLDIGGSTAFTSSSTIALSQNGTIRQDDSGSATLSGSISGAGSLAKSGSGWLGLGGTNIYGGSTTVSSGTLQILSPGGLPDGNLIIAAGGTVIFNPISPFGSPLIEDSLETLAPGGSSLDGSDLAMSSVSARNSPAVLPATSQPALNPVPEPDTLVLWLAAAAGGLLWRVRRRNVPSPAGKGPR